MQILKLKQMGTSAGVELTEEMLTTLKVGEGDALYAIETPEGYLLTGKNPIVDEQLKAGREFMKQYRETFAVLAK